MAAWTWGHFLQLHVNNGAGGFLVTWHHNVGNFE